MKEILSVYSAYTGREMLKVKRVQTELQSQQLESNGFSKYSTGQAD